MVLLPVIMKIFLSLTDKKCSHNVKQRESVEFVSFMYVVIAVGESIGA